MVDYSGVLKGLGCMCRVVRNTFELLNIAIGTPHYAHPVVSEATFRNLDKNNLWNFKKWSAAGFYYTGKLTDWLVTRSLTIICSSTF